MLYVRIFERFISNVWLYQSNVTFNYDLFTSQSVLFTLLFIGVCFTLILLAVSNSVFWVPFYLFIFTIRILISFLKSKLLLSISSIVTASNTIPESVFSASSMEPYHSHHFYCRFFVVLTCFLFTDEWNHLFYRILHWKYFSDPSYYRYISIFFMWTILAK